MFRLGISYYLLIVYLFINITGSEGDVRIVTNESTGASQDYSDEEEEHTVDDARVYKNPRNSPSQDCPRDEDYAEFMGQKCLRKCSNDEDCKSKKKKCYCDGLCGMSCIKAERECDELESPSLGHVTLTGRLFGDKAAYTCQLGYHLVGPRERLCRGDGNWSGTAPQCKQTVYCGPPPKVEHARHNAPPEQLTFQLDTTLLYQCHHGYITNGFHNAKCLATKGTAPAWYGPDMTCEPRSCGAPIDPTNGWHSEDCYTFGCKVTYNCGEGFELVGRPDRACQADGSWIPRELPACVLVTAVECPAPESPQHGTAVYTSCAYNSVVSYECRYGYTLVGDQTRRCGADRKWTGQTPKCQEINCGIPGPVYNGWIENTDKGTGLGASLIFRCQDNMLMVGNASSVCQLDGTWRYPPPQCLAPCVVPAVPQGQVVVSANGSLSDPVLVQHGSSLRVHCESRYEPNTANNPVVCNNGTWSHIPRCLPARCKFLPRAPKNGMVIAPKTDHGMKARFRCRDGFTIRGENTTECKYGNWTGDLPYCQEVYCPFPGYVENGKVLLVGNMGLYDYRPYVRKVTNNKQIMYECDKGYALVDGPPGATCVAGHWSPKHLPRCVPGMHPRLRWSRSVRARRDLQIQALERLQRFRRALVSSTAIRPKVAAPSSNKENPAGGRGKGGAGAKGGTGGDGDDDDSEDNKTSPTGSTKDDDDSDKSEKGHKSKPRPSGKHNRTKVVGPPCETIGMEPFMKLEVLKKGRMPNATYSHGALVRLTCATGYVVNLPNNTARCNKGKWKPNKPKCNIAPCFVPHSEHGIYTKSLNGNLSIAGTALNSTIPVTHTQVVEFSCKVGYNVQGPGTMKCWYGQWSIPILPTCAPAPCQLPVIPNGQYLLGYRPGLTIGNGSQVRFQCDTEYKPSTPAPIQCTLGELRPKLPSCKKDRFRFRKTLYIYGLSSHDESLDPGSMYMPGGDITKAGELGSIDYMAGLRGSCGPPARVQGTLVYKNGEKLADVESFPDGTEVTFHCIANIMGEKVTWRIICEDGNWLGRSLSCDAGEHASGDGRDQGVLSYISSGPPASKDNSSCVFYNSEPNVATFYNDKPVTEDFVEFPHGAILMHRCADIGKFAMIGSTKRRCNMGEWEGQKPTCFGLNQENEYAMDKPPTILFRHQLGPIAQSNDGRLIVYPATILHMECLWIRRFGTPKWVVSHNFRKYPEQWSSDPGRDSSLEYRISILHASKEDSGNFTCITPTRHSHSVEVDVQAIHCEPLPSRRGLRLSTQDTKMNTQVLLTCANGNSLIGAHDITCLPSGNWSAPVPVCESMECPDLGSLSDVNLRASILSREVGGQVVFSCSPGFGLSGPAHSTCLPSGEWAQPIPVCKEVQCPTPPIPENGHLQGGNGVYKAGDLVQFTCNQDHMMEGQPILACQENGRWSSQPPKCVKACSYPGTVISGRMQTVKFYYQIGESVSFTCDPGLNMIGASMLRCLKTGKWSAAIPTCVG